MFSIFSLYLYLNRNFEFKKNFNYPDLRDFYLIALPMTPVIEYALINNEYLDLIGVLYLFGITLTFNLFFCFIFPIIFSYFASFKILMITGLSLSFTILNLAKIANDPNNHILNSQFVTQGSYLILSFIITYLLYLLNRKAAYIFVIVFIIKTSMFKFSLIFRMVFKTIAD